MKSHDDRNKATRASQRAQKEKLLAERIKLTEYLYDWLDSGKSVQQMEIMIDNIAAGGQSEQLREECHSALGVPAA